MRWRHSKVIPLFLSAVVSLGLTAASVPSPIDVAYGRLGGSSGGLGKPTGSETCGLRDGGCYRNYQYGAIVWSPETGAQPSLGAIRSAWLEEGFETGTLGYPLDAPRCGHRTCTQHYEQGSISWSAAHGITVSRAVDDPASAAVVVNKQRPLSADYVPGNQHTVDGQPLRAEAAAAYSSMQEAAAADGVVFTAISGYRSYSSQATLYAAYSAQYGTQTADTISARPGHSEHQTGLAVDIADPAGACSLQGCFEDTAAGAWAAANAHRFGFIVRYPDGASAVTGYAYEPWHLRYVGSDIAEGMHAEGIATLEEYAGLPAAANY